MELSIPMETICRLLFRARELEAPVTLDVADDDEMAVDGDNPSPVSGDEVDEAVEAEVLSLLEDLADDEIAEVLALAWIGRGTYEAGEWDDALAEASDSDDQLDQLMELPMLAAYLEAGLSSFDLSCDGIGQID